MDYRISPPRNMVVFLTGLKVALAGVIVAVSVTVPILWLKYINRSGTLSR